MFLLKLALWIMLCMFAGPLAASVVVVLLELLPFSPFRSKPLQLLNKSLAAKNDLLPAPITTKHTDDTEDEYCRIGLCAMQGWRRSMEDAHTYLLRMSSTNPGFRFFGVFDGHCGADVAVHASKQLPMHIESSAHFDRQDYERALSDGFVSLDREVRRKQIVGGSTAVTAMITPEGKLFCANVGDSRCVVSRKGVAEDLSIDHKPTLPVESMRIRNAGGFVLNGRVMGSLAMSRALGDFAFKPLNDDPALEMVTPVPEVRTTYITPDVDFMVIACDGIWDCASSQTVVDYCKKYLAAPKPLPLSAICARLCDELLSPRPFGLGCDNMSMMIIQFNHAAAAKDETPVTPLSTPLLDGSSTSVDDADGASPKHENGTAFAAVDGEEAD